MSLFAAEDRRVLTAILDGSGVLKEVKALTRKIELVQVYSMEGQTATATMAQQKGVDHVSEVQICLVAV